jgi:hypothetical protein
VPQQKLNLLQTAPVLAAQFRAGASQVVGTEVLVPMFWDDCSTADQTARSLNVSRLTFPDFETERSRRPSI